MAKLRSWFVTLITSTAMIVELVSVDTVVKDSMSQEAANHRVFDFPTELEVYYSDAQGEILVAAPTKPGSGRSFFIRVSSSCVPYTHNMEK